MTAAPAIEEDKGVYLAFTPDSTEDQARACFIARYGFDPERVFTISPGGYPAAGPVPNELDTLRPRQ